MAIHKEVGTPLVSRDSHLETSLHRLINKLQNYTLTFCKLQCTQLYLILVPNILVFE